MGGSYGLLVTWVLLVLAVPAAPCPTDCSCKWKGGKQAVECVNRGLRTFPGPIDAGTQVLDLSGNSFETLPSDHFQRLSLINLQKIYLARCRLSHINSRAFRGLSNLVDLDLSSNGLREVPTPSFLDCQGLMRLLLSGNPIAALQRSAFVGLESLTSLELSHCGIESIEKGTFEGLLSLEWLKLDGNKMRRLEGLDLLPIPLKGLWLEDNPWDCDCRLLELRLWLTERKVANSVEPRCSSPPRLTNATLKELPPDHFACIPQLSPTTMYQKIGEGKNVSLLCKVTSTPESSLEWWFNGSPVSNASLNILIETSSGTVVPYSSSSSPASVPGIERKSELLILNATADENGTFLCLASNPGGSGSANFTLRVLSAVEAETVAQGPPSLVSTYPNLFLILLSTVAVIGGVFLVFLSSLLLCRCWRGCGFGGRGRGRREAPPPPSAGAKDLPRHLSASSTLTTGTKSNGSVFLLSSSSELGDSNPDLIEGVKRVEADGHETSFANGGREPGAAYPSDYGLPKGLNPATLVRRSPAYPNPLPPTYDLAKYPKEYLSPSPVPSYAYGPPGPVLYATGPLYPTTYLLPHPGTYAVYGEEYVRMGYVEGGPGGSGACSCGPIMEESEEGGGAERGAQGPCKGTGASAVKARLQRQLTNTINESPDEGYEDESAEGAEI